MNGAWNPWTVVFVCVFGLLLGSYVSMLTYRLPKGIDTIFRRSHCPSCQRQLSLIDLIPVIGGSLQGWRCKNCQVGFSKYSWHEWAGAALALISAGIIGILPQDLFTMLNMPAGLLSELQSRNAKPIPWRTALISYLSGLVKTPARKRTYTRPSRRASQRIYEPKAARVDEEPGPQHELLMVVDTSGSMEDRDLEEAIGAVIATSKVLGIQRVRVISCDAGATDHGWINVQRLRSNLRLTGGGGTDLRPALALAEQINLHKLTPMLIITDGMFDERFAPTREHAYLMPRGTSLMFHTTAPVFTIKR